MTSYFKNFIVIAVYGYNEDKVFSSETFVNHVLF